MCSCCQTNEPSFVALTSVLQTRVQLRANNCVCCTCKPSTTDPASGGAAPVLWPGCGTGYWSVVPSSWLLASASSYGKWRCSPSASTLLMIAYSHHPVLDHIMHGKGFSQVPDVRRVAKPVTRDRYLSL